LSRPIFELHLYIRKFSQVATVEAAVARRVVSDNIRRLYGLLDPGSWTTNTAHHCIRKRSNDSDCQTEFSL